MDTRYSPEQLELRKAAASLVADLGPRTVDDLADHDRRARLVDAARQAGWFELRTADETGGPLASGVEVAIVARELGRVAADTPFFGPVVAADLARLAGDELEADGACVVLHPSLEDFARFPPDLTDGVATDGVAVDCAIADRGLVLAVGAGSPDTTEVVEVALGSAAPATDLTRALTSIVASTSALDGPVVADAALTRCRSLALAITVADLVGVMEGALDITATYARERQQYGVAIGSFQAVQHLLAEARVLVEGAISVAQYAAWAVDALPPDVAFEAGGVAKSYCTRAARVVCETAIQVHGGIGNTWECFVHVYLRRALLSSALLGDEGYHLGALARRRLEYDPTGNDREL